MALYTSIRKMMRIIDLMVNSYVVSVRWFMLAEEPGRALD
jgi:hypothetical protein